MYVLIQKLSLSAIDSAGALPTLCLVIFSTDSQSSYSDELLLIIQKNETKKKESYPKKKTKL